VVAYFSLAVSKHFETVTQNFAKIIMILVFNKLKALKLRNTLGLLESWSTV
jgi:hypothetical protein